MDTITNTEDVIDSRDIIERIEELEENLETCPHCGEGIYFEDDETNFVCPECEKPVFDDLEEDELDALKALQDEADGSPDWPHGKTLIRDSYFTEYAEELCKDIGDLPHELPWYIENHIDWDGVAEELKADYMDVDFGGVSYFIRG